MTFVSFPCDDMIRKAKGVASARAHLACVAGGAMETETLGVYQLKRLPDDWRFEGAPSRLES